MNPNISSPRSSEPIEGQDRIFLEVATWFCLGHLAWDLVIQIVPYPPTTINNK